MKTIKNRIVMIFVAFMTLSFAASAQIVVKVRPAPVVRVRPVAPSPRHVWVEGNWVYRGNAYVWSDGYWAVPRRGMVWVAGSWRHSRGGWVWVPGSWRRGRY